jgi:hypothetical protein
LAALMNATYRPSGVIVELCEAPFPATPFVLVLTSSVALFARSRTKTSVALFVSPGTRSLALLSNTTYRPFVETSTGSESPLAPATPETLTLTSDVVPFVRSRRNTFKFAGNRAGIEPLFVVNIRLFAVLVNTT